MLQADKRGDFHKSDHERLINYTALNVLVFTAVLNHNFKMSILSKCGNVSVWKHVEALITVSDSENETAIVGRLKPIGGTIIAPVQN